MCRNTYLILVSPLDYELPKDRAVLSLTVVWHDPDCERTHSTYWVNEKGGQVVCSLVQTGQGRLLGVAELDRENGSPIIPSVSAY